MASAVGTDPNTSTTTSPWSGLGLALFLIILLNDGLRLWGSSENYPALSRSLGLSLSALIIIAAMYRVRWQLCKLFSNPTGFAIGLLVLFLSDWLVRNYNLFQGPSIRGEIIVGALIMVPILRIRSFKIWNWLSLLALLMVTYSFLTNADGRLLFSDDNATFQYRLQLLKENFPTIPFYSPLWNAGIDVRDFFATGALNVFVLTSPLIYLCDIQHCYSIIVVLVVFVLPVVCAALAARTLRLPYPAPAFAALLALASTLAWYRWGLKYGTLGFIVSASLSPLSLALVTRFTDPEDEFPWSVSALLVGSISLMVMWSAAGLVFIPALFFVAFKINRLIRSRTRVIATLLILVLSLPWIIIFLNVSNVARFIRAEQISVSTSEVPISQSAEPRATGPNEFKTRAGTVTSDHALKLLREFAVGTNPLLLLFAIPGLTLLPRKNRALFAITSAWLVILGSVVAMIKPQLELDRMLVILALVSTVPCAAALRKLLLDVGSFQQFSQSIKTVSACVVGGFLLTGPFVVSGIAKNRSIEQFHFASPLLDGVVDAINTLGGNGRVLFSGFNLHQLEEGHLAPLVLMTRHPLLASTHVHNLWSYKQIIPKSYLERGDSGILEYLDLHNVSSIFAHEPEWIEYFSLRRDLYKRVWSGGKFVLFVRQNYNGSYFLEGSGEILAQETDRVRFKLSSPDAVLKFNYYPFLHVTKNGIATCDISPFRSSPAVTFIQLKNCAVDAELELRSVDTFTRLFGGDRS